MHTEQATRRAGKEPGFVDPRGLAFVRVGAEKLKKKTSRERKVEFNLTTTYCVSRGNEHRVLIWDGFCTKIQYFHRM